jgi:hypothetical protein
MARTIGLARVPPEEWDPSFREPWLQLLQRAGAAVSNGDVNAAEAVRVDLTAFADRLGVGELQDDLWPVYGALLA